MLRGRGVPEASAPNLWGERSPFEWKKPRGPSTARLSAGEAAESHRASQFCLTFLSVRRICCLYRCHCPRVARGGNVLVLQQKELFPACL